MGGGSLYPLLTLSTTWNVSIKILRQTDYGIKFYFEFLVSTNLNFNSFRYIVPVIYLLNVTQ